MVDQPALTYPIRIGILFGQFGKLNTTALKYLLLHLNTLQSCIEFEILPIDESDRLIKQTSFYREIDSNIVKADLLDFKRRTEEFLRQSMETYRLKEREMPAGMILLTTAKFTDHFNAKSQPNICIIALGHWESHSMAPPSLLEAFVTMTIRQAVSIVSPSLRNDMHLGTRACLFDFGSRLEDTRFKTLHGFICRNCRAALEADGHPKLVEEIPEASDTRKWIGSSEDPTTPAGIVAKLGYDLFLTKGASPSFWEGVRSVLKDEVPKELVKWILAVLLAILIFYYHLK